MNFIEAIGKLNKGCKVRKLCWEKEDYICLNESYCVEDESGNRYEFDVHDYQTSNWEEYDDQEKDISEIKEKLCEQLNKLLDELRAILHSIENLK